MDIRNKNSEYEIDGKVTLAIGRSKASLSIFQENLQDILMLAYCQSHEKTFYKLKDEVRSFIDCINETCVLPMRELLHQNTRSEYRFVMYELCDRFHIKNYREIMAELYNIYNEIVPEDQLLGLWNFAGMLVNETRMMLSIADYRLAEIVPQP